MNEICALCGLPKDLCVCESIAKETQKRVIEIILRENSFEKARNYVRRIIEDVKNEKIDMKKTIMKMELKMELEDYKQKGPHVAVAQRMKDLGVNIRAGSVIKYVVTRGEGMIRDRAKIPSEAKNYDINYYINNQIIPSVEKIFEIKGIKKEDLVSTDQSRLEDF